MPLLPLAITTLHLSAFALCTVIPQGVELEAGVLLRRNSQEFCRLPLSELCLKELASRFDRYGGRPVVLQAPERALCLNRLLFAKKQKMIKEWLHSYVAKNEAMPLIHIVQSCSAFTDNGDDFLFDARCSHSV